MTTTELAADGSPTRAPNAPRVSTWKVWTIRIALLVAIVFVVVYVYERVTYKPHIDAYAGGTTTDTGEDVRFARVKNGTGTIPYDENSQVLYFLSLDYDGRWAPVIKDIPILDITGGLWDPQALYMRAGGLGSDFDGIEDMEPFRPTEIPEEGLTIAVLFGVHFCERYPPGTTYTMSGLPITYSVLGETKDRLIRSRWHMKVVSPPKEDCPKRND